MADLATPDAARKGKIARLPVEIRRDLNIRLRNNQSGTIILNWLNAIPAVAAMVKEQYEDVPISASNLSEWRQGGYLEWLAKEERSERLRELSDWAYRSMGGDSAGAAAAIGGGQLLLALEDFDVEQLKALMKVDPTQHLEVLKVVAKLQAAKLDWEKFKRETAEMFLKFYADRRAKEIAEGTDAEPVKLDKLVEIMFGKKPGT